MKRLPYLLGAATVAALMASAVSAQNVTGQVTVHGFVAPRCGSSYSGDSTFSGAIQLGELTQQNGTLSPSLAGSSANSPAGLATFLVGCTGTGSTVTVSATRLSNPSAPQLAGSSNDVDFTVQANIAMAAGGFTTVNYTTAQALPSPTVAPISGVFANVPGNFEVKVFGLSAENGSASFLVAGNYDATITVTVAPT